MGWVRINTLAAPSPTSPDQGLVVQVPNRNVPVTAAGETDFGIRTDGQGITGRSGGRQLSLDAGCGRGQVPDGERAGLTTHNECAPIREKLARADVIVPVLERNRVTCYPLALAWTKKATR